MDRLFDLPVYDKCEAKRLNPQVLAFVGDAVYTLFIRHKMASEHNLKSGELHKLTTEYVKASGQSDLSIKLMPLLSEEEVEVFKRGRNYKTNSVSKNGKVTDYKRATGFEALVGYLYLSGDYDRINQLFEEITHENWR